MRAAQFTYVSPIASAKAKANGKGSRGVSALDMLDALQQALLGAGGNGAQA